MSIIAHDGCFEDVSAVIDTCPLCSMPHSTCWSFKLDHLFSGQSVLWDQRAIVYPLFLNPKIAVMHWSKPKSYNKLFVLLSLLYFGFRAHWSCYRNSFCQSRFLTATLRPCSLLFNAYVMILVESSGFFNHASAYVDGCYLYIIIHYGMLQSDWGIRSVPRCWRPDPESLKAIDTYIYNKKHTNRLYLCPRMHKDCPYEGWVF